MSEKDIILDIFKRCVEKDDIIEWGITNECIWIYGYDMEFINFYFDENGKITKVDCSYHI